MTLSSHVPIGSRWRDDLFLLRARMRALRNMRVCESVQGLHVCACVVERALSVYRAVQWPASASHSRVYREIEFSGGCRLALPSYGVFQQFMVILWRAIANSRVHMI